jgi:hypothetical protein
MPRVAYFEIDGENPEKLIPFYCKVFGWEFTKGDDSVDYWSIKTGKNIESGINGGLVKRNPDEKLRNIIYVSSVDEFIKKIEENGGMITLPKGTIPKVGYTAYFKDFEGNEFGIMEFDKSA